MTTEVTSEISGGFVDLAPDIFRQRLVIEGVVPRVIGASDIVEYLAGLSPALGMVNLTLPVTHESEAWGWAGWIHWETSGAHFYAWDRPLLFFSVDIYTCKAFLVEDALAFTRNYFAPTRLTHRAF